MAGIGIDFGTTNSVLAIFDGKNSTPILSEDGLPHPSIVWFKGGQVVVGAEAKKVYHSFVEEPGNIFIKSVKKQLGTGKVYDIFGQKVDAWKVASHIFKHLLESASKVIKDPQECVVTVPVYFDGRKRADLRKAAQDAGFYVKTFVHEPFAAFVGYMELEYGGAHDWLDRQTVLVFDWGGGTLDITLIRVMEGRIFELSTGGLKDVAGDQFDEFLRNLVLEHFISRHELPRDRVRMRPQSSDRLAFEAERAKIRLSSEMEAEIDLPNFYKYDNTKYHLSERVTRTQFEELIKHAVETAMAQVDFILEKGGVSRSDVELVLMIGGTSLIPLVDRKMREIFGSRVVSVPNAPTIIAEGAAVVSFHNWLPHLVYPVSVLLSDNTLYEIYPEGTVLLPEATKKKLTFFCTDPRDGEARLIIMEGMEDTLRGRKTKCLIPVEVRSEIKRYDIERVYAEFSFDQDQVLNVKAYGSVVQKVAQKQVYDLCIGLTSR